MIVLKKGYSNKEYADYAVEANTTGKILTILENGDVEMTTPPEPTLEELKEMVISEMKRKRDVLEVEGFNYLGRTFDSDNLSVQRISIAGLKATKALIANEGLIIEWTCKDNSTVSLNSQELLGLSDALANHSGYLHEKYRQIKEAIMSKESTEEVYSINWDTFIPIV